MAARLYGDTGAMPWRRASLQVMRPFPLSSYNRSASEDAGASLRRAAAVARGAVTIMAVEPQPARTRASAAASRRSTVKR